MKRNFLMGLAGVALLLTGCQKGEGIFQRPVIDEGEADAHITINVDGNMITTYSPASEDENLVRNYDLFIFDQATGLLEVYRKDIAAAGYDPNGQNAQVDEQTVKVPTGGAKAVYAIANRTKTDGAASPVEINKIAYPELVTTKDAADDPTKTATKKSDFLSAVKASLKANAAIFEVPVSPFVMLGSASVNDIANQKVSVTLSRQVAKLDVVNENPWDGSQGLTVTSVQLKHVPTEQYLLNRNYDALVPVFGDYAAITEGFLTPSASAEDKTILKDKIYLFYTPSTKTLDKDYQIEVVVKGKLDGNGTTGTDYEGSFYITNAINPNYHYKLLLKYNDESVSQKVTASLVEAWTDGDAMNAMVGAVTLTGAQLAANTLTYPFTAESNYGYELTFNTDSKQPAEHEWVTDAAGTATTTAPGWVDVTIDQDLRTITVKTITDNNSNDRVAYLRIKAGSSKAKVVTINQMGAASATSTMFNGLKWMNYNLGASLPCEEANMDNSGTYGYYYQWGRNLPFPTLGNKVQETAVDGPLDKAGVLDANSKGLFIKNSTSPYDWFTKPNGEPANWKARDKEINDGEGTEPAPTGWRLPTDYEIRAIMPSTSALGTWNSDAVSVTDNVTNEVLDATGTQYKAHYLRSKYCVYGIKKQGTADAYMLKWEYKLMNGKRYLKITKKTVGADASLSGMDAATAADALLAGGTQEEVLFFPTAGFRLDSSGASMSIGSNGYFWSLSPFGSDAMYLLIDDGRPCLFAYYRTRAFSLRCVQAFARLLWFRVDLLPVWGVSPLRFGSADIRRFRRVLLAFCAVGFHRFKTGL